MNDGHRLPSCFSTVWLLVVALLVDGPAPVAAAEDPASDVRVANGRIDITLTASDTQ